VAHAPSSSTPVFATQAIAEIEAPEAGGFAGLLELFEQNYIALMRLAPGLATAVEGAEVEVFCPPGQAQLRVLTRERHTLDLRLGFALVSPGGLDRGDAFWLEIRVYLDARCAEPADPSGHWVRRLSGRHACSVTEQRWRANQALARLLRFFEQRRLRFALVEWA